MRHALNAVVALFLLALAWVAVWVPFHATDALIYGRWSRLIELKGGIHFDGIGSGYLHRPLVYVVQGWLWQLFGFHEWIGRVWSLAFVALLVYVVFRVASADRGAALTGAIAAVLLVATPDVVSLGAAGLTDVPVAALVGLTGLLVLVPHDSRAPWLTALFIAVATVLACLAKPSAYIALVGIGLALLIGSRETLVWRLIWRGVPMAVGAVVALVYAAIQAHRLGVGLISFVQGVEGTLSTGVVNYYDQLNAQSRGSFIAGMEWLGPYLTLPLLFGLIYAVVRVVGQRHRMAATIAAPAAIVLSWLLPFLASSAAAGAVGPYDTARPIAVVGTIVLFLPLWLSRECPEEEAPTRAHLARMLLWALPPTIAWIVSAPFQTRYLSPGWVPLYALIAAALWTSVRGLAAWRSARWAWVVVAVLVVLAIGDLRNLDGLGSRPDGSISASRAVRDLGVSTKWFHVDETRAAADPSLAALVDATGSALRTTGRLLTVDGRLGFYFPLRTTRGEPQRCADLRGYRTLVVTESATGLDASSTAKLTGADLNEATGGNAAKIAFWSRCPGVRTLKIVPAQFGIFRVGA